MGADAYAGAAANIGSIPPEPATILLEVAAFSRPCDDKIPCEEIPCFQIEHIIV